MAVESGFFEAEWDPELYNEETQNYVRKIFRSYWNYLRIYKGV